MMARTKVQPPKAAAKAPRAKIKAKVQGSPKSAEVANNKKLVDACKRLNASSYCINNIKRDKDDQVKMLSHRSFKYFFITSPPTTEQDAYYGNTWSYDHPLDDASGATEHNQIKVWSISSNGEKLKIDMVVPKVDSKIAWSDCVTDSREPEMFTHFNLFIGEYKPDMDEGELIVAFRQWFHEMGADVPPILRGIPSTKLLVNLEADVEAQIRSVKPVLFSLISCAS